MIKKNSIPTIVDVAERAQVSIATVSRVLKEKEIRLYGDAKRRTRRLVLEAWDGQGKG